MFSNWRFWPSALWKILGYKAHQFVNFSFGPDPNMPKEIARLTTELGQATENVQRLEPENERLATASQELASGLAQSTGLLLETEVDLRQTTQERDVALVENEGLVRTNHELVDELTRVNTLLAQFEADYATKSRELKEVVAELKETAKGYNELREHVLGFLAIYWKSFRGRRSAIREFVDLMADIFKVEEDDYKRFKQVDAETALSRLRDFRQLFASLMKHKEKNSPQVQGGSA